MSVKWNSLACEHQTHVSYAAGVAVSVRPPGITLYPVMSQRTGYMSEVMTEVAANNIIYDIIYEKEREELPFPNIHGICITDAVEQGEVMVSDHIFAPRKYELLILVPGLIAQK